MRCPVAQSPRRFTWKDLLKCLEDRGSVRHAAARAELIHRIGENMRYHLYGVGISDRTEQTRVMEQALSLFADRPGLANIELGATIEEAHAKVSDVFNQLIDERLASRTEVV